MKIIRCEWPSNDSLMIEYHDTEWGVPLHDDAKLFEFMLLDAFQAGLSWKTVLHKRDAFRKAFSDFTISRVANYDDTKIAELLANSGIIRNRLKINAAISNAKAFQKVQKEFKTFDQYIWQFVNYKPIINRAKNMSELYCQIPQSDAMSKDLQKRGFKFVGSTICYAFMQAAGMVNDHVIDCFRYQELQN